MLRTVTRAAATAARAVGRAARPAVRKMSTEVAVTEASGAASSSAKRVTGTLEIPAWGLVGIGAAAAGFFGKMLHDDNLQTRQELIQLRESSDKRFDRVDERFDRVDERFDRVDERFDRVGQQLDDIKRDIKEIAVSVAGPGLKR